MLNQSYAFETKKELFETEFEQGSTTALSLRKTQNMESPLYSSAKKSSLVTLRDPVDPYFRKSQRFNSQGLIPEASESTLKLAKFDTLPNINVDASDRNIFGS